MKKYLAIILCFISITCFAEKSYMDGNFFYRLCSNDSSEKDEFTCLSFISGFSKGAIIQSSATKTKLFFCPPPNLDNNQIKDIFVKHLKDNPERRHMDGVFILSAILVKNFPCDTKQKKADKKKRNQL